MEINDDEEDNTDFYFKYDFINYLKNIYNSSELCIICQLDEHENGCRIPWTRYNLVCGHTFHTRCFRKWATRKQSCNCPYCGDIQLIEKNKFCNNCNIFGHSTYTCTCKNKFIYDNNNIKLDIDYSNYIIKQTKKWGTPYLYSSKDEDNKTRLNKKWDLLQESTYILDHYNKYVFKPPKGQPKQSQTFLLCYPYVYDNYIPNNVSEAKFIEKLNKINLRFYKEKSKYNKIDAYRILIMDTDCNLEAILKKLTELKL
jgi:hypothetical protein